MRLRELEQENELLRQELAATLEALIEARGMPDRDEVVSFIIKVPAQRGWHRWTKATYRSEAEAKAAALVAADNHSRARIVERRAFVREKIVATVTADAQTLSGDDR